MKSADRCGTLFAVLGGRGEIEWADVNSIILYKHLQVLAGALKDGDRASIVASENTFGKGLIQTIVTLPDGSGLAITVAK